MTQEAKTTSPPVPVVSGGSSGIGKAFVAALRARGYAVVTCGRDPEKLGGSKPRIPVSNVTRSTFPTLPRRKGSLSRTGALSSPVAARRAFVRREPGRKIVNAFRGCRAAQRRRWRRFERATNYPLLRRFCFESLRDLPDLEALKDAGLMPAEGQPGAGDGDPEGESTLDGLLWPEVSRDRVA